MENPGPSELWVRNENEAELKRATDDLLAAKDALAKVIAIADPSDRAIALLPMTKGKYWHQRKESLAAMGDCGPAALPALHGLLREHGGDTSDLTTAIGRAARDDAGREMTTLLGEELAFWRKEAPALPIGWWNHLQPESRLTLYRSRYGILGPAMTKLSDLHYLPARDVVRDLRDLWLSLPQLNDKSGLDQITEQADKLLRTLDEP
jgi:hypothetical protein